MENRVAKVELTYQVLSQMLAGYTEGIPNNARLMSVIPNPDKLAVTVMFEHPTFATVAEGANVPSLGLIILTKIKQPFTKLARVMKLKLRRRPK